jgi:hypothetical protein
MAIVVVCPSCRASFQVNDKFAGKQGPCPKCKATIKIPELGDEVKIHEPEFGGPGAKDSKGRSVLKPIARVEAKVPPVMVAGIVGAVVLAFAVAFALRGSDLKSTPLVLGLGAVVLAPPVVMGGYTFLRNQELEPYRGQALAVRVAICSLVYAALWGAVWALKTFVVGGVGSGETWKYFVLAIPPMLIGALTSLGSLDLDFGSGFFHYCLYLVTCILLRLAMKLPVL